MLTAFVAAPLYRPAAAQERPDRERLEARRETLVTALRELELDHAAGALPAGDYEIERTRLESEAAAVLAELD